MNWLGLRLNLKWEYWKRGWRQDRWIATNASDKMQRLNVIPHNVSYADDTCLCTCFPLGTRHRYPITGLDWITTAVCVHVNWAIAYCHMSLIFCCYVSFGWFGLCVPSHSRLSLQNYCMLKVLADAHEYLSYLVDGVTRECGNKGRIYTYLSFFSKGH